MLFPNSTWRWLPQKVQLVSSILHLVNRKPLIKYDQRLFSWAFRCESLVSKSSISLCNLGHEFVSGFQPMTCVVSLSTILASCISLVRVRLEEIDQVWSPIRTTNPRSQVLLWPRVLSFTTEPDACWFESFGYPRADSYPNQMLAICPMAKLRSTLIALCEQ